MKDKLSESLFTELRKYLIANLGLDFSNKREKELVRKVSLAAEEFNFTDTTGFVLWLLENNLSNKQLEILACHLTVGETYFLREKKAFDFLEQKYLPELICKRRGKDQRLRIWSAGCASGEEPYSIAIMLLRAIPDIKNWHITILATDINSVFLKKAKKGIYTKWSFRNNPKLFIDRYFKKCGKNEFQILPEIKKMVTFSYLNLVKDTYPSLIYNKNAMDIIFCRNVLIYFSQEVIKDVTRRLYNSLVDGGILLVSPVEMSNLISPKFSRIYYSGFTIYQKDRRKKKVQSIEFLPVTRYLSKRRPALELSEKKIILPELKSNLPTGKPAKTEAKQKEKQEIKPVISDYETALKLYTQGYYEKVENFLSGLLEKNDENTKSISIITLLSRTKANLGNLEEARIFCEKALSIDKLDSSLYYLLAIIQSEQGNDEDAVLALSKAIYLDPDFVMANFFMGNLVQKMGNNNAGQKHYKNTLNILAKLNPEEILPESDGLTAGRLTEIISITNDVRRANNGAAK